MSLKERFQGCLVGAVIGDCLGAPFEITGIEGGPGNFQAVEMKLTSELKQTGKMEYTDDTAMARSVADSLIKNNGSLVPRDLARRFGEEFERNPNRGYGYNVTTVLSRLGDPGEDVYSLARKQFDGNGSYGNGGAMRVAPVGLCRKDNVNEVIQNARDSARLTHSNPLGYNGAIVEALAVHQALHTPAGELDPVKFAETLLSQVREIEDAGRDTENDEKRRKVELRGDEKVYSDKLETVVGFLKREGEAGKDTTPAEVVSQLGNSISAPKSVVTAIYSFLRCLTKVDGLARENPFERTILYAISLDGDTDTIATMAGAIAGAYHGVGSVPGEWLEACEDCDRAMEQASELFDIHEKRSVANGGEATKPEQSAT